MKHLAALLCLVLPSLASALEPVWQYRASVDDFDGKQWHEVVVGSQPGTAPAMLLVRCEAGKAPVMAFVLGEVIVAGSFNGGSASAVMRMSVDSNELKGAAFASWPRMDNYQGAYTYRVRAVLDKLEGGTLLRVRSQGVLETFDAAFDLTTLSEALAQLQPHCRAL